MDTGEKKARNCLKCGRRFVSTHYGHRLCWVCNDDNVGKGLTIRYVATPKTKPRHKVE